MHTLNKRDKCSKEGMEMKILKSEVNSLRSSGHLVICTRKLPVIKYSKN